MLRKELKKLAKGLASGEMRTPYQPVDLGEANLPIDDIVFTWLLIGT